jgi:hypothetical protein
MCIVATCDIWRSALLKGKCNKVAHNISRTVNSLREALSGGAWGTTAMLSHYLGWNCFIQLERLEFGADRP